MTQSSVSAVSPAPITEGNPCGTSGTDVVIIHADEALIVADKPAGLLAVPGRGPDKQDCLGARVQKLYPDALVVHRLDMDTSGLLCFGRGAIAQRELSIAFAERRVSKRYVAVVHGRLIPQVDDWNRIDLPLLVDWVNRPRSKVDRTLGKPSVTHWRVIAFDPVSDSTRVELAPFTGRSHQLRVHLEALGHPIIGDPLYGPPPGVERKTARMMLHAVNLTIPHPSGAGDVSFESLPPF